MKKALFLPFLTMQTGHHQVADALMAFIEQHNDDIEVKKVDLLSYANPFVEKVISRSYLSWIQYAPTTYAKFYSRKFDNRKEVKSDFKFYNLLLKYLVRLLDEEQPDIIFCTQSGPSYLLNKLKQGGQCNIPVVNVYTDFFMNQLWGIKEIDYHFVPMQEMKELLCQQGVVESNIFVTGIPVHEEMLRTTALHNFARNILIAGGNLGLMNCPGLYEQLKQNKLFHYYILCGRNAKLYEQVLAWRLPNVTPVPYIDSRLEMNRLYDQMDAIVTKPGGVTVSEVLHKRLPIFVHSVLPGQEEHNLKYLTERGLAYTLDKNKALHQQLEQVLLNDEKMTHYRQQVVAYLNNLQLKTADEWVDFMQTMLGKKDYLCSEHFTQSLTSV
ncbi:galactosyldiacylglycerol synthase [Lysinibacillus louembei]|uniref:Galactosyldiacylglycerol synthase n=1 Tax=Lysinibacillus louembei TaxID=1470088 RepID=A0ABZ0S335_9BACI|nr:glycosyltransferase [Lysinibacillus louembei]WPK13673.1 galactosyldiacylglycerol synthase [Lysinibacillus louembei]